MYARDIQIEEKVVQRAAAILTFPFHEFKQRVNPLLKTWKEKNTTYANFRYYGEIRENTMFLGYISGSQTTIVEIPADTRIEGKVKFRMSYSALLSITNLSQLKAVDPTFKVIEWVKDYEAYKRWHEAQTASLVVAYNSDPLGASGCFDLNIELGWDLDASPLDAFSQEATGSLVVNAAAFRKRIVAISQALTNKDWESIWLQRLDQKLDFRATDGLSYYWEGLDIEDNEGDFEIGFPLGAYEALPKPVDSEETWKLSVRGNALVIEQDTCSILFANQHAPRIKGVDFTPTVPNRTISWRFNGLKALKAFKNALAQEAQAGKREISSASLRRGQWVWLTQDSKGNVFLESSGQTEFRQVIPLDVSVFTGGSQHYSVQSAVYVLALLDIINPALRAKHEDFTVILPWDKNPDAPATVVGEHPTRMGQCETAFGQVTFSTPLNEQINSECELPLIRLNDTWFVCRKLITGYKEYPKNPPKDWMFDLKFSEMKKEYCNRIHILQGYKEAEDLPYFYDDEQKALIVIRSQTTGDTAIYYDYEAVFPEIGNYPNVTPQVIERKGYPNVIHLWEQFAPAIALPEPKEEVEPQPESQPQSFTFGAELEDYDPFNFD